MPALLFTQKKKKEETKAKISYRSNLKKTYWSMMIMRITPWYDGKWLAKSIYDVSGIQNWDETLACVKFYRPERFSSIQLNPMFLLMLFRNKIQKCLNLIHGFENSIFVLSFLIVAFLKKKMCVVLIDLGVWFL